MGRKAKLKKQRQENISSSEQNSVIQDKQTQFVKQMQRQGYSLKHNQLHSPHIPDDYIEPEV